MSVRTKKFSVALLVMALLLIGIVGAAQAQTPDPANPPAADTTTATPNHLQQMQERLGPVAYGQMIQRMTERHGAEAAGEMLQRMATTDANDNCDGTGHGGMMGSGGAMGHGGMMGRSDGTTGWFGGMMNGLQRGAGRMMGSWH
jgi:hypothetical protein